MTDFDPVRWKHAQMNAERLFRGLERIPFGDEPTPQVVIEAIMWCVRERGLDALSEPKNRARLSKCNAAARSQINDRIDRLMVAGRIPERENA